MVGIAVTAVVVNVVYLTRPSLIADAVRSPRVLLTVAAVVVAGLLLRAFLRRRRTR